MIRRFSLYGFLKNQQYYDPFIILAFREKGLSFFAIGLLIAFREICINVMEIPSGAAADVFGRRRSMILSFAAYIAAFAVFGLARSLPLLFAAMFFFSVGEAFRTGTHKAMIFTWLRMKGRENERSLVYGLTRSWSMYGSALSALIAMAIVLFSRSFQYIFFFSIIPYIAGIINFLGYPKELDGNSCGPDGCPTLSGAGKLLRDALSDSLRKPALRRLLLESMGFEGVFKAAGDYLQPLLQAAAIAAFAGLAAGRNLSPAAGTALLAGPVFFIIYILSGVASRRAHSLEHAARSRENAVRILWAASFAVYFLLIPAALSKINSLFIAGFVLLNIIQNLWRPIQIARYDAYGREEHGATILSIESQAKTISTTIAAPLLGRAIDAINTPGAPADSFWPVPLLGAAVCLVFLLSRRGYSGAVINGK